jgi:hypothetical protein
VQRFVRGTDDLYPAVNDGAGREVVDDVFMRSGVVLAARRRVKQPDTDATFGRRVGERGPRIRMRPTDRPGE